MKLPLTLLLFIFSANCYSQTTNWNRPQLARYFKLTCVQTKLKYQGKDTVVSAVYPEIITTGADKISQIFKDKKRRFEYLLQNQTSFKGGYGYLYPDTVLINKLYLDTLAQNKAFIKYLTTSLSPFNGRVKPQLKFSKRELLAVASRFFYCDKVMPDTSIYWHVCIGLNGIKDTKWQKDYTLLEAFCFEAIFNYLKDRAKAGFMDNFVAYTTELKNKFILEHKTTAGLLHYVRTNTFEKMATDKVLIQRLNEYYELNKQNLSFELL